MSGCGDVQASCGDQAHSRRPGAGGLSRPGSSCGGRAAQNLPGWSREALSALSASSRRWLHCCCSASREPSDPGEPKPSSLLFSRWSPSRPWWWAPPGSGARTLAGGREGSGSLPTSARPVTADPALPRSCEHGLVSHNRDQDDFLGWAPAEPLEWEPEASSWEPRRKAPVAPQAPQPASAEPVGARPPSGWTTQPRQQTTAPRPQTYRAPQPPPPARAGTPARRQAAGPLLGITAIAAGFMLLFTVSTLLKELFGGSALGPVPVFTGIGTLMLARAAWAMRPR